MYTLVAVLILIVCVLLVLVVLVQNSKGGGLAANFQSSNAMMGVRKTADFLEKATWTLATALIVLSVLASSFIDKNEEKQLKTNTEAVQQEQPINDNMIPQTPGSFQDQQKENAE